MKWNLTAIAFGIGLACGTCTGFAQTSATVEQNGTGNDAYVEQSNAINSTLSVSQTGNGARNTASIYQH